MVRASSVRLFLSDPDWSALLASDFLRVVVNKRLASRAWELVTGDGCAARLAPVSFFTCSGSYDLVDLAAFHEFNIDPYRVSVNIFFKQSQKLVVACLSARHGVYTLRHDDGTG